MLTGAWLIASPWVFPEANRALDDACGALTIFFAILSFFRLTRWAHLGTGAVALWLGGTAYFTVARPGPPATQNELVVAILLLMLFVLPNEASKPPEPWRVKRS
jgi:hypothetical protein